MADQTSGLFSLQGKVIVVTGGTGVLGSSFVKAIAKQGATAVIIGRNEQTGLQRASEVVSSGGTLF